MTGLELFGLSRFAAAAGKTYLTMHRAWKAGRLPEPTAVLHEQADRQPRPLWTRAQIDEWLQARKAET